MTSTTLQTFLTINFSVLIPAVIALASSIIGSIISKEDNFNNKTIKLLGKLLNKKVVTLRLLFDSIEFTATSLGEVRDFKGKKYFTDIDRYSNLERRISFLCQFHRIIISLFHYTVVAALIIVLFSFVKLPYLSLIIIFISILLIIYVIIGIIIARNIENKVTKISQIDELKHNE